MSNKISRNRVRDRFNAWFFGSAEGLMHRLYGERLRTLLGRLHHGQSLLEIGAGAGSNFRYYPPAMTVHAVEPNGAMHGRLLKRAQQRALHLKFVTGSAEQLPLPDASIDIVVSSLVLCSVQDPNAVLDEIRRVLKPGGRFVFVEHVCAQEGTLLRGLQKVVRYPWRWLFNGCCVDRYTELHVRSAGFSRLHAEHFTARSPLLPVWPHVAGSAVK